MYKVSVIIPVYGVEKFIRRCAESLFNQTLRDVEYIFVNDCTKDSSMSILQNVIAEHPEREAQVTILEHEANKGLAGARNTGLAQARGEYVFHCDSDDFVEATMLERMYLAAKAVDADMAYCDFYISFEKNERYMGNPDYSTGEELLRKGLLSGHTKYNVWNKLVKRSVYVDNGLTFPEGHNMGEDMTMIMVAACSKTVVHVKDALYHYVKLNTGAYSNTASEKHLADIRFNMDRTIAFLENKFGDALEHEIVNFKLSNKLPFLITDNVAEYRRWQEWYPETNEFAFKGNDSSLRLRVIQWAAAKGHFWIVKLHYWLVFKLVYGVIYR